MTPEEATEFLEKQAKRPLNEIDVARFWTKVQKTDDGCWLWTAYRDMRGYGTIKINGKGKRAHRVSWEIHFGVIPLGMCVCHRCDNPSCVRLDHLFLGTSAENTADSVAKGRQARGDRSGARLHPESRPRGANHYSHLHPELRTWGDRNGSRKHPERRPRGELHSNARLTVDQVRQIRDDRGKLQRELAIEFGVKQTTISHIQCRKIWKHIP